MLIYKSANYFFKELQATGSNYIDKLLQKK